MKRGDESWTGKKLEVHSEDTIKRKSNDLVKQNKIEKRCQYSKRNTLIECQNLNRIKQGEKDNWKQQDKSIPDIIVP